MRYENTKKLITDFKDEIRKIKGPNVTFQFPSERTFYRFAEDIRDAYFGGTA